MSDAGIAVVDYIYNVMSIDARWAVREPRGFTWWAKDFAQRVWAEPPIEDRGFIISRIHARTDVLRDFSPSMVNLAKLAVFNAMASLSALVWNPAEPNRVRLAASMYAHDRNLPMVERLLSLAVALQAADAQTKAETLAASLRATCDSSAHPSSGARPECDDMLNVIENLVAPLGREPSFWAGKEMEQAVSSLQQPPCVLCTGDAAGLAAEFPLFDRTMLVRMKTGAKHPRLGNGLLVRLSLPFIGWLADNARDAAALNVLELEKLTRVPFLGSWYGLHDGIHFVGFYPNSAHVPGLLQNIVLQMVGRAHWVAHELYEDNWERSYERAAEEKLKTLSLLLDLGPDSPVQ